ncbi:hypothetical protein LCGC14_2681800, partial [marine sediment metagenome]
HKELLFYQYSPLKSHVSTYKMPLKIMQIVFIAKFFPNEKKFFKQELMKEAGIDDIMIAEVLKQPAIAIAAQKKPADRVGPINLEKMSPQAKGVLQKLAKENPSLTQKEVITLAQRKGLVGVEAQAIAEEVLKAPSGSLGAAIDYERGVLEQVLTKQGAGGSLDDAINQAMRVKKLYSEPGRALESMKHKSAIGEEIIKQLQQRLLKTADPDKKKGIQTLIDAVSVGGRAKPEAIDYVLELWQAGILSSSDTILRNLGGNVVGLASKPLDTFTAGIVDAAKSAVLRRPRTRFSGEAAIEAKAYAKNFPGALKKLWQFLRHEKPPGVTEKVGRLSEALGRREGVIPGKVGKAIRLPFRPLRAGDESIGFLLEESSLSKAAFRKAKLSGLTGNALKNRVAELMKKPSDAMLDIALKERLYYLYQSKLGHVGAAASNLINQTKVA